MAIDGEGNIYVADEDPGSLSMLDRNGKRLAHVQSVPGLEGLLTKGDSMVVLSTGRIILIGVTSLVEVELAGGTARLVRLIGEKGSGSGQFEDGEGLARDANGDLYLTDEDNRRIDIFDQEGRFVRMWPVPAEPEGICITGDRVYVTFSKECWIGRFNREGRLESRFGRRGTGPGEFEVPDFICRSPGGLLYVTDQHNHRIQVFDLDGAHLFTIGGLGAEPGRFRDPEDLAFDGDGNLLVADGGNHRLQVLTPAGKPLRVIQ